jgi:hypothetical protein
VLPLLSLWSVKLVLPSVLPLLSSPPVLGVLLVVAVTTAIPPSVPSPVPSQADPQ